jgi:hypothetical protein
MTLQAFHNDPAVKAKYLARVREHAAADRLVKGTGWDGGKGCAVGCTLEAYDHSRYPVELGLPEWLARLEDSIFEGLPVADAMTWPERFLAAIPVGAKLEPVRHKLTIRRLDRLAEIQTAALGKHGEDIDAVLRKTLAALAAVKRCHESEIGGNVCSVGDRSAAEAAESAAESAAWSAESVAESAARSAASAARSAESAARSAESAARSAESAARSAWSAAWSAESAARSESAAESAARSESAAESAARSAAESAESAARSAWSAAWSAAWRQEASDLLELLAVA